MLGEDKLRKHVEHYFDKQITNIQDKIYFFKGFGHSTCTAIIGDTSVILVDALDSDARAKRLKAELKKITDKEVKTIIYTHGHPDHRGGSIAFKDTVEEIIAFTNPNKVMKYFDKITPFLNRRAAMQFGYELSDEDNLSQGVGIREGHAVNDGKRGILPPTTLYDQDTIRTIDGVTFEMVRAIGECDDEIFIYLKDYKVTICADNFTGCFPNLYALRGTSYRDVSIWVDSLSHMLEYDTEYLLPGHSPIIIGKENVNTVLTNYRDAIESILLQTIDCLSKGYDLEKTVRTVSLDKKYQELDYLGEYYGTVEWSVKSIYNGYVGWFDGNPVKLMPVSEYEFYTKLVELAGKDRIIEEVIKLKEENKIQLALELIELVVVAYNEGHNLKKELLWLRAKEMTSANGRHFLQCSSLQIDE